MSATKNETIRLSHNLSTIAKLRAKECNYRTRTGYVKGLIRYDALCRSHHGITTIWDLLTPEEQDELEAKLLERALKKQGMTAAQAKNVDWRTL